MSKRTKGRPVATALAAVGLLLSAADPAAAVGGGNVSIGWSIPNAPSSGLTNITFPITVNRATAHQSGIYFAQQYYFEGNGGYTGLQPRPDVAGKERLRGVFSVFGEGASTTHANCHSGADNGSGISCGVEFDAVYGHPYDLKVARTGTDTWTGTATDTVTGTSVEIGTYTVEGSGGIKASRSGFVEYYLSIPSCSRMPRADAVFGGPTSTDAGGLTGTSKANHEYNDCVGTSNYRTETVGNGVHVTRGYAGSGSKLVSQASGKCLDNLNGGKANGNPVGVWTCNSGANQQWAPGSDGRLAASGRCLDAAGRGTTPGTDVTTWSCHGGTNQQWALQPDGTLRGTRSGLCLGVVGASTANGAFVELQTCNGGASQRWTRG
ncbi:RICIN domain-containing protein [Streptomyces sp. SS]|uniref:RICIN domain-containing protein n=1 Tax=Streptomyces sp. SS TaxID=260742 RepID=UPI00031ECBB2|nr:RICIN domain-containing protein [Streptomyces sp. SS]